MRPLACPVPATSPAILPNHLPHQHHQPHSALNQRYCFDDADKASLDAILAASPELAAVAATVRSFAAIMNERRSRKLLEPWMTAAEATGEPALRSFVTGLRADQDAVANGLTLCWVTSPGGVHDSGRALGQLEIRGPGPGLVAERRDFR